ncbi:unnamed protein product [Caenorhabditis brenneri]
MSSPPPTEYQNYRAIQGVPTYINVEYSYDWVSMLTIVMLIYTIPCVFVFSKIVYFYFKNRAKIKQVGLRIEVFQSFLLMQFWNILWIIGEFFAFRIPYTRLFTSYCASENPQLLLKIVSFFYFFGRYSSQLFTVVFCGLRVAVMYSLREGITKKTAHILPFIIVLIGFSLASPNIFSEGACMQVAEPYPFGSIAIISRLYMSYSKFAVYVNLAFISSVTFSIVLLTGLMVRKVRERKTLLNTFQVSAQNSKVEKTLTTTMFILLVPLILNLSVSIGELFHVSFFSYILLLRPLFLDARVHIVTCYFYLTHPVFKTKQVMESQVSVVQYSSSKLGC